jgi:hypothetical protein
MVDPARPPAWFTPARLLAIFCAVNTLLYLDRGLFASNGVNGSPRTAEAPRGSGIQVRASEQRRRRRTSDDEEGGGDRTSGGGLLLLE